MTIKNRKLTKTSIQHELANKNQLSMYDHIVCDKYYFQHLSIL